MKTIDLNIQKINKYSILRFFGIEECREKDGACYYYIENEGQFHNKKKHVILCTTTGVKHDFDFKSEALREIKMLKKDYGVNKLIHEYSNNEWDRETSERNWDRETFERNLSLSFA